MKKLLLHGVVFLITLVPCVAQDYDDMYAKKRSVLVQDREIDLKLQVVKFAEMRTLGMTLQLIGGIVYAVSLKSIQRGERGGLIVGSVFLASGSAINYAASVPLLNIKIE